MIVLAYVLFFGYFALIVTLGEILQRVFKVNSDIVRKIEHILTAPVWLMMYLTIWPSYHVLIICLGGTLALGIVAFTPFFKGAKTGGLKMSYGVFYFGLSCSAITLFAYFFDTTVYPLVGLIYFVLSLADGFAPLVARLFKKHNYVIRPGKTLAGCSTVIIISFLVIFIFNLIFKYNFSVLFMISFACLIFGTEYYGFKGLDNIFIVVFGFAYLLLEYYGYNNIAVHISLLLLPILVLINSKTKSVTEFGFLYAVVFGLVVSYCSGLGLLLTIAASFLLNLVIVKIVKLIRIKKGLEVEPHKTRGLQQIAANSIACLILSILARVFNNDLFTIAAIVAILEEIADSMASDLGRYCKNRPIDIIRFKFVEPGLSGGVSWLGTLIALFFSFSIATIGLAFGLYSPLQYVFLSLLAFLGMIIDSILGSLIQVKYICPVCEKTTEKKVHCDVPTIKHSGISFVNNSMVNLLSSVIISGITLLLLFVRVI